MNEAGIRGRRLAMAIMAAALAGGCANQNSIFRYNRVSGDQPVIVTEDAKQRNLVMVRDAEGRDWRMCAEASPDVFSALSTSAGADLGFGQSGGQTEARAKAAIAIAEAAGTIERTQTINMLRESMYRTCERYLSGAIDKATFVVQAGRDWRAMIAILAIEQLTRTARPQSTIISAGSTSATVEGAGDATRQLIAAQGRAQAATRRKREAEDGPPATCPPPADPPPAAADSAACDAKQRAVARAQADLDEAQADVATWKSVLASGVTERSVAETGAGPDDPGGVTTQPTNPTTEVAYVVRDIVQRAFDTDETQLFCLQTLSKGSQLEASQPLQDKCMKYLLEKVESDRQRLLGSAAVRDRIGRLVPATERARERVLAYLRGLSPEQFAQDLVAIRRALPTFCRGMGLAECIDSVDRGALDGEDPQRLVALVEQQTAGRGQW